MEKTMLLIAAAMLLLASCGSSDKPGTLPRHRGVYHWKTTYNPTDWEKQWMKDHKVDRLYVRLFDVEPGRLHGWPDWKAVPVATTLFRQQLPDEMDVVPVVYITVDAIRELEGIASDWEAIDRYAALIVKRIDDMMADHWSGSVREVQIDCDWTRQTEHTYFTLAKRIYDLLGRKGIILSGTLRLHQLADAESDGLPFDRSMLMLYNTGRLQNPKTENSILDFDDAEPYLRQLQSDRLPLTDIAWPVYGWGVEFYKGGSFRRLVHSAELPEATSSQKARRVAVREEWGEPREIQRTQEALPELDASHTTILYHLDSLNLSKYSYEDIEAFYSR